jgi:hypothetical protein
VPLILSSDKTKLTDFSGGKQGWPVYLTVGNVSKEVRPKVTSGATVLIGYLPVLKASRIFASADSQAAANAQLFHYCMGEIVAPLRKAGLEGVLMGCADGYARRCFPVLAAYVADNPEQCMIAGCKNNRCHRCTVAPDHRGDPGTASPRDPLRTANDIAARLHKVTTDTFSMHGLNPVERPFWAGLPHANIFTCLTPDLLHQIHRGVFKDHLLAWCQKILGSDEMDRRFIVMPDHSSIIHFPHGVSGLSQTTGRQHKNMEKVFAAVVNGSHPQVVLAASALLDFIQLASLPIHTEASIAALENALARFHQFKDIFVALGGRELDHFDLNKLHALAHYGEAIRSHGALDGYNTEWSERMHIELVKEPYDGTNGRDTYLQQMTKWLDRHEKIVVFRNYLNWRIPGFVSRYDRVARPRGRDAITLDGCDDEEAVVSDVMAEPSSEAASTRVMRYVVAKTPPWPSCTSNDLAERFGCTQLQPALSAYLAGRHIHDPLLPEDVYAAYTRVSLLHRPLPSSAFAARLPDEHIHAGNHPRSLPDSMPSFDTVLAFRRNGASAASHPSQCAYWPSSAMRPVLTISTGSVCCGACTRNLPRPRTAARARAGASRLRRALHGPAPLCRFILPHVQRGKTIRGSSTCCLRHPSYGHLSQLPSRAVFRSSVSSCLELRECPRSCKPYVCEHLLRFSHVPASSLQLNIHINPLIDIIWFDSRTDPQLKFGHHHGLVERSRISRNGLMGARLA